MKKKLFAVIGAVSVVLLTGSLLFAGNDAALFKQANTSINKVISDVKAQNLKNVKSVSWEDVNGGGQWEVKAQTANMETKYSYGKDHKLTQVKQENDNDLQAPADLAQLENAVKAAQEKGYKVSSVEFEGKYWEVEGYGSKDLEHVILVDSNGKVVQTSLDD